MKAIRLPWLTERMERQVLALAPVRLILDPHDEHYLPPGCIVFRLRMPSAMVIAQAPDALPGADCYDTLEDKARHGKSVAWARWQDHFLTQVIAEPRLSESDIQDLGADRDHLTTELLRLWGWIGSHGDDCPSPEISNGHAACRHFDNMPNRSVQDILRYQSARLRIPPHRLLREDLDFFCFDFRVLKAPKAEPALEDLGG